MKQSRISNRKLAALTIAAVAIMVTIAMVTGPSMETKIAEEAPPPIIKTDTIYFPGQYTNKAIGPSDPIPTF